VVLEQRGGKISRISWEALAAGSGWAQLLGAGVTAASLARRPRRSPPKSAPQSLGKVVRVEHPLLKHYTPTVFCACTTHRKSRAGVRRLPAHLPGARLRAALAAAIGQVLIGDVVALRTARCSRAN
jgi:electron transfer flavoprotein alpha subunit